MVATPPMEMQLLSNLLGVVVQFLVSHNEHMSNTYTVTAHWGSMRLAEEIDVSSDMTPDNEMEYCKNEVVNKWQHLFGNDFIDKADQVTVQVY